MSMLYTKSLVSAFMKASDGLCLCTVVLLFVSCLELPTQGRHRFLHHGTLHSTFIESQAHDHIPWVYLLKCLSKHNNNTPQHQHQ